MCAAQTPAAAPDHDIVGTWQGTLHVAAADNHPAIDLRIVNKITKGDDGKLKVSDYSIDQGGGRDEGHLGQLRGWRFQVRDPGD